jgi:hypothetical protein
MISILLILGAFCFTPWQIYVLHLNKISVGFSSVSILIFMSFTFFIFGFFELIKTNHPNTRYNPFSFNPNWKNKMEKSMDEDPSQLFRLEKPDKNFIRDKKIDKILKN